MNILSFPRPVPHCTIPSVRLSRFFKDPYPPLCFFSAFHTENHLSVALRACEVPAPDSCFSLSLWQGDFSFHIMLNPRQNETGDFFSCRSIGGEDLMGVFWGSEVRLTVPASLHSLLVESTLFHGTEPLCALPPNLCAKICPCNLL